MTASNGLGTYGNGAGVVTPTAHKLAHLGLVSKTGAGTNTVRPGLFYDGVTTIVSGTANMSYDVVAFTAVSSRGGTAGAVFFANDGVVNVVTTAAPGTDSRIDVVYAWQREFSLDGGTTGPVIGVVQGAVAPSPPPVPSLSAFPGAIELARITVPAGVTATNSGATITQTAPFTALNGAPIPVRNVAGLPTVAVAGSRARTIDTGVVYEWSGSAWTIPPIGLRQVVTFTASGTFTKASYPWARALRVKAQGPGGGGGSRTAANSAGPGGGGGGYAESFITDIAGLAASVTVTVGAGGAGAAAGADADGAAGSSASSFGALVVANAGAGSAFMSGGLGGSGGTGDILIAGGTGGGGAEVASSPGDGGNAVLGSGGGGGAASAATATRNGRTGAGYGGGGGGSYFGATAAAGAGAPGVVIVEIYG